MCLLPFRLLHPRELSRHARKLGRSFAYPYAPSWTAALLVAGCGSNPVTAPQEGGSAQGENSFGGAGVSATATGTSADRPGQGGSTTRSSTAAPNAGGGATGIHATTSAGSDGSGSTTSSSGGQGPRVPVEFVVAPTLVPNANDSAPLAAIVRTETNVPTTGYIRVASDEESWTVSFGSASTTHEQALLGVKPDTQYRIAVSVTNGGSEVVAPTLSWHTPALPEDFPRLQFVRSAPDRMQPGMTMFDVRSRQYLVVVDNEGQVRWYYRTPWVSDRFRLMSSGNLAYVSPDTYLTEIDWFGNAVTTWYASKRDEPPPSNAIAVDVDGFHHNFDEMPSGNLLVLCRDNRYVNGFPTSADDPDADRMTTYVYGDEIVEFTRTGRIVRRYSLFDLLDTTRVGHADSEIADWSHSNAVIYDADSDAYVVSIRHQDAVVKLAREDGRLIWILGNHANWGDSWQPKLLTPVGDPFEWQYHQHAIELTPGGIGLYDNGNYRAPAYATPLLSSYSRAVRYAIDEHAMTVAQLWSYRPTFRNVSLYSSAMSDADWQPNGNVLVASGTLWSRLDPPGWAQIVEVSEDGETLFELNVVESPLGTTFDADRIPDIRYIR